MKKLFLVFGLMLVTISAIADNYPQGVRIEAVDAKGSGCPSGSVRWTIAPNSSAISFLFDRYSLQGTSPLLQADCQFRFLLKYPRDYRLKVIGVDYRGAAVLPAGVRGSMYTRILQTVSKAARVIDEETVPFQGDYNDSFILSRVTNKADWVNCGGAAALTYVFNSRVTINNPQQSEVFFQVDSADNDFRGGFSMDLAWEKCQ